MAYGYVQTRTVKMKITQMNDKVIITYIDFKKVKYTSQQNSPSKTKTKKRERKKSHYTNFNYPAKVKELWL